MFIYRVSHLDLDSKLACFNVLKPNNVSKLVICPQKATEFQRNRFCRRNPASEAEHTFHVGLHLSSRGRQSFSKLVWIHHSCHITYKYSKGESTVTLKQHFWVCFEIKCVFFSSSGWLEKRSSLHSTWTRCTTPSSLHAWRVILLFQSSLCKHHQVQISHMNPPPPHQEKSLQFLL